MKCTRVDLPGGASAIVCSSGPRARPCTHCGRPSTRLCDWRTGRGATCDAPLCDDCTTHPAPDKDLCRRHAERWETDPRNPRRA